MSKSIRGTKKSKRGRPKTTGTGIQVGMRWPEPLLQSIDEWRAFQEGIPSRPEAIRRLVELGLLAKNPDKKPTPAAKRVAVGTAAKLIAAAGLAQPPKKSSEMAGEVIDRLGDGAATDDERARRKRRLIKGPTEFREMRGARPKPKG